MKAFLITITTVLVMATVPAKADLYNFGAITSYTNAGYQSVASQLTMEVVSYDTDSAVLLFSNTGPVVSSVAEIYFDYTGTESYSVAEPSGWNFLSTPPFLPAGDTVGFDGDFRLKSDPPPTMNGITAGESLSVTMSYDPSFNIIDALNGGILRVGLHTIGIPDTEGLDRTYSESTVNVVPEAASSSLILLSSASAFFLRRFFRT